MYRILKSLWFTKEEVNFAALDEGVIFVKFGAIEDRRRILNLSPWLFDQCLFALLPFVKGQDLVEYAFNITPFWTRIYNIPLEQKDRQVAIDVGEAIGEVLAIDWRDRDGGWTDYIRLRIKIDVFKPLRRMVHLVGSDGIKTVCTIKYERFARLIGHTTQKCSRKEEHNETGNSSFQYGSWLKVQLGGTTQMGGNRRNVIEIQESKANHNVEISEAKERNGDDNDLARLKEKEKKTRAGKEELESCSLIEK
ncbi:hypothetical protein PVK06_027473 [Gossypium arboreum]|uniref:DUF4283 domain-containing protein n=1 Tax=Gossypium arboreum TaxID=29729 RepID=A0ABR0P0F3_GOSAR|nr:hypothetical protein PVK06_027473 [Gossypium arboreum]